MRVITLLPQVMQMSLEECSSWSAVCVFVCSCDWYHPMNFVRGELHSEARIDIVLDTQQKLEQLLPRYIEVANAGGYPYSPRKHRSVTLEELYSESFGGSIAALYWQKKPNAKVTGESLMFRGEFTLEGPFDKQRFKREALAEKVILVLQKGSPDSFTKEEVSPKKTGLPTSNIKTKYCLGCSLMQPSV